MNLRQATAYGFYTVSSNALFNLTKAVALVIGGAAVVAGTVSGEALTTFMLYVEFATSASLRCGTLFAPSF